MTLFQQQGNPKFTVRIMSNLFSLTFGGQQQLYGSKQRNKMESK